MTINEEFARRLQRCTTLPSPPATAIRIIELANDGTASLMQISDCLALDPALATKMLRVANSPLYSTRRAAANVRQAVNLMGMHTAITVALSFSMVRNLKGSAATKEGTRFWQRSILSALACRILAQRFSLNVDDLLLAGLLQDIGVLALRTALPDEYAQVAASALNHDDLLKAERATFGSGHDEVGYWLLKKWNLPDYLALACLASHSAPSALDNAPTVGSCVAMSGYLAEVFLSAGDEGSTVKANHAAHRLLGMEPDAVAAVIQDMCEGVKEVEALFDLPLIDAEELDALATEAKELVLIANLGKLRDLEEISQRDALTGAHNRLFFDNVFRQEFAVATRHGWPLSLAFIDIDHFKSTNDTHGHAIGDNALVTLSGLISAQIRNGDVFARYGGDEFVLLFPGTSSEPALKVLTRIREAIESYSHTLSTKQAFTMTISTGLATHVEGESRYESPEHMLRAADEALYVAKGKGRNQIVTAPHVSHILKTTDLTL